MHIHAAPLICFSDLFVFFSCVLSVFVFLVVVGTVYDVIRSQRMSSASCGKTPERSKPAHAPETVLEKYTEIVTISGDNGGIVRLYKNDI